jgi:hypothetical protein
MKVDRMMGSIYTTHLRRVDSICIFISILSSWEIYIYIYIYIYISVQGDLLIYLLPLLKANILFISYI